MCWGGGGGQLLTRLFYYLHAIVPAYLALIIVIVDWALKTTFPPCLGLSVLCFGKFGSFYLFIVLDVVVFFGVFLPCSLSILSCGGWRSVFFIWI